MQNSFSAGSSSTTQPSPSDVRRSSEIFAPQRQKAVDLRITVPVTWLKADMHTILHSFVLEVSDEESRWPDCPGSRDCAVRLVRLLARALAPDPKRESKQDQASGDDDDSRNDMEAATTCEGEDRPHHAQRNFEYGRPD